MNRKTPVFVYPSPCEMPAIRRSVLRILPIADQTYEWFYRVLYEPAFHPEFCITLHANPDRTSVTLQLATAQTNLWYWEIYQRNVANGQWPAEDRVPRRPEFWSESAVVNAGILRPYLDSLSDFPNPTPTRSLMDDGMGVECEIKHPGRTIVTCDANGLDDPSTYEFCWNLAELASRVLVADQSKAVLSPLLDYYGPLA